MLKLSICLTLIETTWLIYLTIYCQSAPASYYKKLKSKSFLFVIPGLILLILPIMWCVTAVVYLVK